MSTELDQVGAVTKKVKKKKHPEGNGYENDEHWTKFGSNFMLLKTAYLYNCPGPSLCRRLQTPFLQVQVPRQPYIHIFSLTKPINKFAFWSEND